jgi:glycosyltransferase involved in cell wall biosynthesis
MKATVIMSCFNSSQFLAKSIDSVLLQSFKQFEFLIIDDYSTDDTYEILNNYSKKDERIKVYKNKVNLGLTANLNFLIKEASGEYIVRIDADDVCKKDRFYKQIEYLDNNPTIGLVGSSCNVIDEHSNVIGNRTNPCNHSDIIRNLIIFNPINHPTVVIRTEIALFHLYDTSYRTSQDWDLWIRLYKNKIKFYNLPEKLIDYRVSSDYLAKKSYRYRFNELKIKLNHFFSFNIFKSLIGVLLTIFLIFLPNKLFQMIKSFDPRTK